MSFIKALVLTLAFVAAPVSGFAASVGPNDAAKYIGKTVTVEGRVSEVKFDDRSGVTFIDMGGRYPNHTFTGIIFSDSTGKFPDVASYEGRIIGVTGMVRDYKGKPEIILRNPGQITLK